MTTHTVGRREERFLAPGGGTTDWVCLAAAPTFAIMAFVTGGAADQPPDIFCTTAQHVSPLSGMALMYLLMSVFHLAPWFKLIRDRRAARPI
jgi:hypothetical protein